MTPPLPAYLYLASQSPRRSQLLDQLGEPHRLLLPEAHEDAEALEQALPRERALAYVQRVTLCKLDAAVHRLRGRGWEDAPILCADTTVVLGQQLLGKPRDADHARQMLAHLAGRSHRVMTAVALAWGGWRGHSCSVSYVRFAPLDDAAIVAYVASGEPMGKAGAYAIQGRAGAFVESLRGSYSGIMGLPLFETAQLLRHMRERRH